jgi:ribosomal protein S6--L-glutamate ligase
LESKKKINRTIIGWEEWCALPELNLPAIKAKVDTGAKTSALHAFNIRTFSDGGMDYVSFDMHPLQKNSQLVVTSVAPIIDRRFVSDSGGNREKRLVIRTPVLLKNTRFDIELTLTNRDTMAFRMLLGRQALRKGKFLVSAGKSCLLGKYSPEQARSFY